MVTVRCRAPPLPLPLDGCVIGKVCLISLSHQMHEMLQLLHQDVDSETGSYTDSGRGPSEEGDNNAHGNTLETHLGPDNKGKRQVALYNIPVND